MKSLLTMLPALFAALILAFAPPALAQKVTRLSDGKIRSYYSDLSGLFKKPYEHFLTAYGERIHPDLSLTTRTRLIVPGQEPIDNAPITLTKNDIVQNAQQAYEAAKDAVLSTRVNDIRIAADGRAAAVKTTSTIRKMKVPAADGSTVDADSIENCDDTIVLTESGALQIIRSSCASEITIKNMQ